MERLSYKSIILTLLLLLAVLSIAHTLITKGHFRKAALRSQAVSLSRVLEVASNETVRQLHDEVFSLGTTLQKRLIDSQAKQLLSPNQLTVQLDELFVKGFSGTGRIDLAKMRVYDTQLVLVAQSHQGLSQLPDTLPEFLKKRAQPRQGAERLKALGGLWRGPQRPLYSMLLPIGGLRLHGYLELVIDPAYNLDAIGEMTRLPIRITTQDDEEVYRSPSQPEGNVEDLLAVEYEIRDDEQRVLYQVTAYENNAVFYTELQEAQLSSTMTFIISTVIILLLALYLLNRLLFAPVSSLINNVQQRMEGKLDTAIDEHGVKEVYLLAHAFNQMARTLHHNMSELQRLSSLDGLTGIANRRAFDERFNEEWTRALRNRTSLSVMILDIDNFKQYNDSLGHQAGDQCLREVAQILESEMKRPGDFVARYGGEEFAIVLAETDSLGAGVVALNIRAALAERALPHPSSTVDPLVTVSIGVNTICPLHGDAMEQFIVHADRALYEAKHAGRNGIAFATSAKSAVAATETRQTLSPPH